MYHLFNRNIAFVNSQHAHTNLKSYLVPVVNDGFKDCCIDIQLQIRLIFDMANLNFNRINSYFFFIHQTKYKSKI